MSNEREQSEMFRGGRLPKPGGKNILKEVLLRRN